jgi:hypothetical protein
MQMRMTTALAALLLSTAFAAPMPTEAPTASIAQGISETIEARALPFPTHYKQLGERGVIVREANGDSGSATWPPGPYIKERDLPTTESHAESNSESPYCAPPDLIDVSLSCRQLHGDKRGVGTGWWDGGGANGG